MTATYELAAWFTVVGVILGAALTSWWYEGALKKADRDYRKRTAEAVANVRREAGDLGYRHGWTECQTRWRDSLEEQAAAEGRIRRHLYAVNERPGRISDAELEAIVNGEDA